MLIMFTCVVHISAIIFPISFLNHLNSGLHESRSYWLPPLYSNILKKSLELKLKCSKLAAGIVHVVDTHFY